MNKLGGHGGQLDIEGETESSGYTRHSYVKAQLARKVHQIIGRPSIRYYTCYVAINTMIDCPITFANVKVADYIFGKDKGSPVGKIHNSIPLKYRPHTSTSPRTSRRVTNLSLYPLTSYLSTVSLFSSHPVIK